MAVCEQIGLTTIDELMGRLTETELMDWWFYWRYYGDPITRRNMWTDGKMISRGKAIVISDPALQREIMMRNSQ